MNRISMRRLKTTILSLPQKHETIINLELKTPWNEIYERNHQAFSDQFGKNQTSGQGWNSSSFFAELVDLRQLCNHPALMEKGVGTGKYSWAESSKIVHLMQDLKSFLRSGVQFRAVIFSEFKRFLEIIEVALNEERICFTTHYGKTENDTRRRNLERFRENPQCKILLATIKTAGVGIDLRCAQKVYIMIVTGSDRPQDSALAPLRGASPLTPPIFSSIRSADDPQANPTIDDPTILALTFDSSISTPKLPMILCIRLPTRLSIPTVAANVLASRFRFRIVFSLLYPNPGPGAAKSTQKPTRPPESQVLAALNGRMQYRLSYLKRKNAVIKYVPPFITGEEQVSAGQIISLALLEILF
ncbi:hypothetical protein PGTUg99_014918 [Puccinia graminis f. sp. tritici]|uniref:Helicase C-terminal domain-containing protein n=1 Tax=Puccinia graminis f. sp. tritici TaxID=56615 RepID=A0A5B0QLA8_PUCGR|nr:hypothetical protein PGTUg99_014918 [Puccinia graminis f. sp. tritici]